MASSNATAATEYYNNATVLNETNLRQLQFQYHRALINEFDLWSRILIILLGSIGNCISIIIFCSTKLRTLSSSYYLIALATSDTVFLLILLVRTLQGVGYGIFLSDIMCRLFDYMTAVSGFLSVWFVVAFTVERFIAVQYPLLRPSMCTVSRAKTVIAGLTIAAFALYAANLANAHEVKSMFGTPQQCYPNLTEITINMNTVDTVVTMFIPTVAIVCFNTCICVTVHRLSRQRRRMTLNGGRRLHDCPVNNSARQNTSSQNKVTRLLLSVSIVFIVLNIPSYLLRIFFFFYQVEETIALLYIQSSSYTLYYLTFGINFVLYCMTGQNFRKSLLLLCSPKGQRPQDTTRFTDNGFEGIFRVSKQAVEPGINSFRRNDLSQVVSQYFEISASTLSEGRTVS